MSGLWKQTQTRSHHSAEALLRLCSGSATDVPWPESWRLLCELPSPVLQLDLEKVGSEETLSVRVHDDLAAVNTVTFLCHRAEMSEIRGSFFPQISHKVLFFCNEMKYIQYLQSEDLSIRQWAQTQTKHLHRGAKIYVGTGPLPCSKTLRIYRWGVIIS